MPGKHYGKKMKMKSYKAGGGLKSVPDGNKGLGKLPEGVRNKMGYKAMGGKMKSKMSYMKAGGPIEQFD